MVLFLSFGEGLRRALGTELSRVGPALLVLPEGGEALGPGFPELPPRVVKQLNQIAPELGITQVIPTVVFTKGGFDPQSSFFFQGLPAGISPQVMYPGLELQEGSLVPGDAGAVVGGKVAERNKLQMGKTLRLSQGISLKVVGIIKSSGGLSDNLIYAPIGLIQQILGTGNYTSILLNLAEGRKAEDVAATLKARIPGIEAQTTGDVLKFAERAVRISDLIRFGISLVALIVGGLLVANTVMMSVYERIREFGLMRALGAKRRFIFGLVLLESLLLGIVGGLIGLVVGQLASGVVNWYTLGEIGLPLSAITPRLALFALAVAVVLGLLAGYLPARTASRLKVVEALGRV
jgi:putative ABC transport system permease protein